MRAVIQRVSEAKVTVDDVVVGSIGHGLVVLLGVGHDDTEQDAKALVDKVAGLRVFSDDLGKMNLSIEDVAGEILLISQFTLLGDVRRGRRPSFVAAAAPGHAEPLVDRVSLDLRSRGIRVATGTFGAHMDVSLINDGPVTLVVDVRDGRVG